MKEKCILLSVCALFAVTSLHGAEVLFDDFSDLEVKTPTRSTGSLAWDATGSFSADGTYPIESIALNSGELAFDTSESSLLALDLGRVADGTTTRITFDLRQGNATTAAFYFKVACKDTDNNVQQYAEMSPQKDRYAGVSGFHGRNSEGHIIAGTDGTWLHSHNGYQSIVLEFRPQSGVTIYRDGTKVAEWPNFNEMQKVNRIEFSHNGVVSWFIDNVKVEQGMP